MLNHRLNVMAGFVDNYQHIDLASAINFMSTGYNLNRIREMGIFFSESHPDHNDIHLALHSD
jgi:hypothetical protein